MKIDQMINMLIWFLFKREVYIKPNGLAACLGRTFITCLHDAGTSSGNHGVTCFNQEFRRLLGLAMAGKNDGDIEKSLARAEPVRVNLQVNDNYPSNVPLQSMPPTILLNLPRLPPELEYLINGHALVLHDTAANLIVDIIPDAVP